MFVAFCSVFLAFLFPYHVCHGALYLDPGSFVYNISSLNIYSHFVLPRCQQVDLANPGPFTTSTDVPTTNTVTDNWKATKLIVFPTRFLQLPANV